jgi:hypothetical protein
MNNYTHRGHKPTGPCAQHYVALFIPYGYYVPYGHYVEQEGAICTLTGML